MFGFSFGKKKKDPVFDAMFGAAPSAPAVPRVAVGDLPGYRHVVDHGEKFAGGLGPIDIVFKDYYALRLRSADLYERNPYARGLIRRLVTNTINTGLHLESTPEETILGLKKGALEEWADDVENRFTLWGKNSYQCDFMERLTFGALQAEILREALITGDILVMVQQDARTRVPRIRLITGDRICTPLNYKRSANVNIVHGVELDARGRQVAYHVLQEDGSFKRIPAFGEKSGRRIAWLVYGSDKRLDDVRGTPILGLVLQSLKDLDRYRDATLRKAVINSMIAMWIEKSEDTLSTRPLTGAATKRTTETTVDNSGTPRSFKTAEMIPGAVFDELAHGEKVHAHQTNHTVENFGTFEEALVATIAWAYEIPPEILTLSFSSNYSASQAAISEFKIYLNPTRARIGNELCGPIFEDWLIAEVIKGRIVADGLLDAFQSPVKDDIYGAWISNEWQGQIKPSLDPVKTTKGYSDQADNGFVTRDRASREINGSKFVKNVAQLKQENILLADAMAPLIEAREKLKSASMVTSNQFRKPPEPPTPEGGDDEEEQDDEPADAPKGKGSPGANSNLIRLPR